MTRNKLELAKQWRKAMMPQERMLRSALLRNVLAGLHFGRQQIIADIIAEFYCAAARPAVEIDGGSHLTRKEYDSRRDKVFSELGIRTLRLSSESVSRDLAGVLRLIEREATRPASHP